MATFSCGSGSKKKAALSPQKRRPPTGQEFEKGPRRPIAGLPFVPVRQEGRSRQTTSRTGPAPGSGRRSSFRRSGAGAKARQHRTRCLPAALQITEARKGLRPPITGPGVRGSGKAPSRGGSREAPHSSRSAVRSEARRGRRSLRAAAILSSTLIVENRCQIPQSSKPGFSFILLSGRLWKNQCERVFPGRYAYPAWVRFRGFEGADRPGRGTGLP